MKGKSHQRWKKILVIHTEVLDNNNSKQATTNNLQQFHRDRKALPRFPKQRMVSQP